MLVAAAESRIEQPVLAAYAQRAGYVGLDADARLGHNPVVVCQVTRILQLHFRTHP